MIRADMSEKKRDECVKNLESIAKSFAAKKPVVLSTALDLRAEITGIRASKRLVGLWECIKPEVSFGLFLVLATLIESSDSAKSPISISINPLTSKVPKLASLFRMLNGRRKGNRKEDVFLLAQNLGWTAEMADFGDRWMRNSINIKSRSRTRVVGPKRDHRNAMRIEEWSISARASAVALIRDDEDF